MKILKTFSILALGIFTGFLSSVIYMQAQIAQASEEYREALLTLAEFSVEQSVTVGRAELSVLDELLNSIDRKVSNQGSAEEVMIDVAQYTLERIESIERLGIESQIEDVAKIKQRATDILEWYQ
ncbi:hypothetical protein [Shewanella woodyi]|uniref:Uncharacterized protein n=1 Tax=Shewanella woodyi (strain ATCC 51908 / MS32) TaxID=392500 RepID=B1KIQ7_SHEWM|nr:hypothetical protein [Shewanella woodyi]ACA88553.1 hypothetical protein Swoo_4298 [Shewanella woodyi ATCC 51908]